LINESQNSEVCVWSSPPEVRLTGTLILDLSEARKKASISSTFLTKNEQASRPAHLQNNLEFKKSTKAENDPRFRRVVRRHFHLHFIAHDKSDKALPHFAGNMSQHLVTTWQRHLEHGSSKHRRNRAFDFNRLLLFTFFGA